jgi:multidrug resistance efflux pump
VVEVQPNVTGQVIAIPVKPNVPAKTGAVLFQIDPVPFQFKVAQLEAALVQAQQQAAQLKPSLDQANANVEGLTAQLAYQTKRLGDFEKLVSAAAATEFRLQDTQAQVETLTWQLEAAKAARQNAMLALESQIGGENPAVAQIKAQLGDAKWELEQTTIRAPGDGYVTVVALAVGDRATQLRSAMSFVLTDEIIIVGMFSPNGFQAIKSDAKVTLVFDSIPGTRYQAKITEIPRGVGQGQVGVSGTLARAGAISGVKAYPAVISIPDAVSREQLRLGMPGTATVFAANAGVIGTIASILIWINSYTAYL